MSFNCGNLLTIEKSVGGHCEKLRGCMQDMSPGAAVGEEHAGNVERAASVAIAQDACALLALRRSGARSLSSAPAACA